MPWFEMFQSEFIRDLGVAPSRSEVEAILAEKKEQQRDNDEYDDDDDDDDDE